MNFVPVFAALAFLAVAAWPAAAQPANPPHHAALRADPQPLSCVLAAVSVGVVDGRVRLDLPYEEDSRADVDMNIVCTGDGRLVEVQGTAEGEPFDRALLDRLLDLGTAGCAELTRLQQEALRA